MKISGVVSSGLGQGAQFLAVDWVVRELRSQLGLAPFPGTLNLRVKSEEREALFARRHEFIKIADPSSDCPGYVMKLILHANGRSAGAYLILPEKSQYNDVLETIAAAKLRESLAIDDGDVVEIEA